MDSLLACEIEPYVIVVGGTVRPSAKQFFAAPRTHAPNPASGSPSAFTDLNLTRFPFEVLRLGSEQDGQLTRPARWLGYWMGDGTHNPTCATAAHPEVRQKIHQLVVVANDRRPLRTAPLQVREYLNRRNPHVWAVHVTSTVAGASLNWWNTYRTGLQRLGVFANDKQNGIPEMYHTASEATRAALLAGVMDSDGWANQQQAGSRVLQIDQH